MKNFSKNLFRKEAGFVLVLLFSFFSLFSCAGAVTTEGGVQHKLIKGVQQKLIKIIMQNLKMLSFRCTILAL